MLVLALAGSSVLGTIRYVDANSAAPTPPSISWATAATNIQSEIDAVIAGDDIVVTNGACSAGVYSDSGAAGGSALFYRVGVGNWGC